MHKWYDIPKSLEFTGCEVKTAMFGDESLKLDMHKSETQPNTNGIFHKKYKLSKRVVHGFYAIEDEAVHSLPTGTLWYQTFPSLEEELASIRSLPKVQAFPPKMIDIVLHARAALLPKPCLECGQLGKRKHDDSGLDTTIDSTSKILTVNCSPSSLYPPLPPGTSIYWDSKDAKNLFNAPPNETALDCIKDLIAILANAAKCQLIGYKTIVEGHNADDTMSDYQKNEMRTKALYLLAAYHEAK